MRAEPSQGLLTYGPIKVDIPEIPQSGELLHVCGCLGSSNQDVSVAVMFLIRFT